ncbi:MAG TPA: histidine phosphatase family protein [Xanthobacteraceae bacterium]|nr:histidine phosphatase family protein [Xanthobacteraceae bacterium]
MNLCETRWWWVRHAPVPDGGRIYGQRDLACDCSDTEKFSALAQELPRGAVWITSHLSRTRQTAAAILSAMDHPDAQRVDPVAVEALAEQHLGEWQGLDRKAFLASRANSRHRFWFGPATERAPGGESFHDVMRRVSGAVEQLTRDFRGRDIIAVTHGGTIRAALALALRLDPEAALAFVIDNCSVTRIEHLEGDGVVHWRIGAVNHRPWVGPWAGGVAATGTPFR